MTPKAIAGSLLLFASAAVSAQTADPCAPRTIRRETLQGDSPGEIAAAERDKVTLSPQWDDMKILAAFGFTKAKSIGGEQAGVCGPSTEYRAGKNVIDIGRSHSTGMSIVIHGGGPHAGVWSFHGCMSFKPSILPPSAAHARATPAPQSLPNSAP